VLPRAQIECAGDIRNPKILHVARAGAMHYAPARPPHGMPVARTGTALSQMGDAA
jgi:hypothetical protein